MEQLLQYVWQHRLWRTDDMTTNDGHRVRVLDPGLLNTDAGPDFFNAKVEMDGCGWETSRFMCGPPTGTGTGMTKTQPTTVSS